MTAPDSREYADRDHMELGDYYTRHVSAMTTEGLHAKSDIAAELAWRDREIDRLQALARGPQQAGGEDGEVLCHKLHTSDGKKAWRWVDGPPNEQAQDDARNFGWELELAYSAEYVAALQAEVARLTSSYVELETMYRQQGLNAFALLKRAETAEVALREAREILIDVMGWIPNGGAWHTEEPMKAMERARAFLSRDAALNGGQDDA